MDIAKVMYSDFEKVVSIIDSSNLSHIESILNLINNFNLKWESISTDPDYLEDYWSCVNYLKLYLKFEKNYI